MKKLIKYMLKKYDKFLNEEIFIRKKDMDPSEPSILYINGSRPLLREDGSLVINRRSQITYNILSQFGDNVIYPSVYWRAGEMIFDEMIEIVENNNVIAIVGNSAGGYVSFNLSNEYKIPAMSINPAMASTSEAPILQPVPFGKSSIYPKQLVIIGDKDEKKTGGVDGQLVIKDLKNMGFRGEILILENTHHRLSSKQFDDTFKHFYKRNIRK